MTTDRIQLPTRHLKPATIDLLKSLVAGDRVTITHRVRVGGKTWNAEAKGVFRMLNYLSTGVTTERVKSDDIVVPTVHFLKDNGELASMALDEHTTVVKG